MDLFDYKPKLEKYRAKDLPSSDPHGPAAHRHDRRASHFPDRAVDLQVRPARPKRGLAQRTAAAHRDGRRPVGDHQDRCTPKRSTTIRPSPSSRPALNSPAGPASARGSPTAWEARIKDLPAYVVLTSQGHRPARRSAALRSALGQRISAHAISGRQVPQWRRPGALSLEPAGHRSRDPPRDARRTGPSSTSMQLADVGDPEIATRIAQYEMAFRMQASVPELTDIIERAAARARHVWPGRAAGRAPMPPTACWPGGWPSAACGSCSSSTWAGTTTAICRTPFAASAATPISRPPALINDLKQRGLLDDTLVVWGGEFGRTVYSQGTLTDDRLRPRSSSALLQRSGWPAAESSRA